MEFTVYKKTDDIDEEFAGKGAKKKKQKEKSPKNHLISGIVHSSYLNLFHFLDF